MVLAWGVLLLLAFWLGGLIFGFLRFKHAVDLRDLAWSCLIAEAAFEEFSENYEHNWNNNDTEQDGDDSYRSEA